MPAINLISSIRYYFMIYWNSQSSETVDAHLLFFNKKLYPRKNRKIGNFPLSLRQHCCRNTGNGVIMLHHYTITCDKQNELSRTIQWVFVTCCWMITLVHKWHPFQTNYGMSIGSVVENIGMGCYKWGIIYSVRLSASYMRQCIRQLLV